MERYNLRNYKKEKKPKRERKGPATNHHSMQDRVRRFSAIGRRFPQGVRPKSPIEHFDTRTVKEGVISTALVRLPLRSPQSSGSGTILGGTSKDSIYRARLSGFRRTQR